MTLSAGTVLIENRPMDRSHLGTITVDRRFHGPPDSANGGYVSGRLAAFVEGPATVRLLRPPALDTPMTVRTVFEAGDPSRVELTDENGPIARAWSGRPELEPPAPPTFQEAERAALDYRGHSEHVYPTCFVCGPQREPHDGLCLFAGPIEGRDLVAAPWRPGLAFADDRGDVADEYLWAALDCPGAFAFDSGSALILLGELTAEIHRKVTIGTPLVVTGWSLGEEGRKRFTGTAIHTAAGDLVATARGIWFVLR